MWKSRRSTLEPPVIAGLFAPVAQQAEQRTCNAQVVGSIPAWCSITVNMDFGDLNYHRLKHE